MKARTVNLIYLVEFPAGFRFERGEGAHSLHREHSALDQKKHPSGGSHLEQPVDLIHEGLSLPGSGGHSHEQVSFPVGDRAFHSGVCLPLVWPSVGSS
jgi:hypothetical protein